jgi:predicted sulfurtransferase
LILLALSACSPRATQTVAKASPEAAAALPLTEAEVPRVSVEDAKAALDSGEAVIVDVRSDAAYEASHVAGAINIQLGEFETNPAGIELEKDQWIITYCT